MDETHQRFSAAHLRTTPEPLPVRSPKYCFGAAILSSLGAVASLFLPWYSWSQTVFNALGTTIGAGRWRRDPDGPIFVMYLGPLLLILGLNILGFCLALRNKRGPTSSLIVACNIFLTVVAIWGVGTNLLSPSIVAEIGPFITLIAIGIGLLANVFSLIVD